MLRHSVMLVVVAVAVASLGADAQQAEALPPLNLQAPPTTNLLADPGFEDPDAGAWRFSDWPPRPETGARLIADSVRYTTEQAFAGERALVFDLTTVGADRTLIAQQKIDAETLAPHDGATMRLSARVLLASGPTVQPVRMTMRQWGEDGLLDHHKVRITADVNEWARETAEFTFRMGETTRADVNVTVGQGPDLTNSPVVYLDDARLEVVAQPPLNASLPWGTVVMAPESLIPVEVEISREAWQAGLRGVRWDMTGPDGLRGHAHGEMTPDSRTFVLSIDVPNLSEGSHAVRVALGEAPGEREHEILLPFRRVEGPFAR